MRALAPTQHLADWRTLAGQMLYTKTREYGGDDTATGGGGRERLMAQVESACAASVSFLRRKSFASEAALAFLE